MGQPFWFYINASYKAFIFYEQYLVPAVIYGWVFSKAVLLHPFYCFFQKSIICA